MTQRPEYMIITDIPTTSESFKNVDYADLQYFARQLSTFKPLQSAAKTASLYV
jgi:hypothetical protein